MQTGFHADGFCQASLVNIFFLADNSFFFIFLDKSQSLSFVRELDHLDFRKTFDTLSCEQMISLAAGREHCNKNYESKKSFA